MSNTISKGFNWALVAIRWCVSHDYSSSEKN